MGPQKKTLSFIEEKLDYSFQDPSLFQRALTHASDGSGANDYETLEFLGDRALGLVVSRWLIERFPETNEGDLARRHTALVRKEALVTVAKKIKLSSQIRLSKGEKAQGTHQQETILADVMEALIGALFTDGGYQACEKVVKALWMSLMETLGDHVPQDAKTRLQEWAQAQGHAIPSYEIEKIDGPAHAPEVWVRVDIEGVASLSASGLNRKEAAQKGAQMLCDKLINKVG